MKTTTNFLCHAIFTWIAKWNSSRIIIKKKSEINLTEKYLVSFSCELRERQEKRAEKWKMTEDMQNEKNFKNKRQKNINNKKISDDKYFCSVCW